MFLLVSTPLRPPPFRDRLLDQGRRLALHSRARLRHRLRHEPISTRSYPHRHSRRILILLLLLFSPRPVSYAQPPRLSPPRCRRRRNRRTTRSSPSPTPVSSTRLVSTPPPSLTRNHALVCLLQDEKGHPCVNGVSPRSWTSERGR